MSVKETRRLKMEVIGTGRMIEVVAKGKCGEYPCRVDGWRCPRCTQALAEAYRSIIVENFDSYQEDVEELKTRKRQVNSLPCSQWQKDIIFTIE